MIQRPCRQCGRTIQCLRKDKNYCNHICRRNWYRAHIDALAILAPIGDGSVPPDAGDGPEQGTRAYSASGAGR